MIGKPFQNRDRQFDQAEVLFPHCYDKGVVLMYLYGVFVYFL